MVAVFHGWPEIAMRQTVEVSQVLFPNRLIQMIFGQEIALDFRGSGGAFAVERSSRSKMHQKKSYRANHQHDRNSKSEPSQKIHPPSINKEKVKRKKEKVLGDQQQIA
jgi:hypothetical protein